jgi:putative glycosyltransferase (TIGR04372 family)
MRVANFILNNIIKSYNSFVIIITNLKYFHLFCYVCLNKINVLIIGNGAIGHYPINIFLCNELYKGKNIFVFKTGVEFANVYLNEKLKKNYHFDQRFEKVYQIMEAISFLSGGLYNFNKCPEQMQMGYKINIGTLFDNESKLFEFSENEDLKGNRYLDKLGVDCSKFVCLLVRDHTYYSTKGKRYKDIEMRKSNFRNTNPLGYVPAVKYLVDSGYHVIRMGKDFTEKFPFSHSRFIDYALSEDRDDFLDIWLSSHCKFFLSSSSGIGGIPVVFNTPMIFANCFPIGRMQSWSPKSIHLPRMALQNGNTLNIRDMVEMDIIWRIDGEYYDSLGLEILENESDDILEAVKEMEANIESGFLVNELNLNFWKKIKKNWHGNITTEFSKNEKFTFDYFHKIDGINAVIPDNYLKKHEEALLNY